jgi:hypothetical protein
MVKITSVCEAEIGDFITYQGKISIISSVQQRGDYAVISLKNGEVIVFSRDQKNKIQMWEMSKLANERRMNGRNY